MFNTWKKNKIHLFFKNIAGYIVCTFLVLYAKFIAKKKVIIIAQKYCQLGNRITLFGHFISYAIEEDIIILDPSFYDFAPYFESTENCLLCRYPPKKTLFKWNKTVRELLYSCIRAGAGVVEVNEGEWGESILVENDSYRSWDKLLYIDGKEFGDIIKGKSIIFIRGWRYRVRDSLVKYGDELRFFFTPTTRYRNKVMQKINDLREEYEVLIGVHIRQKDSFMYEQQMKRYIRDRYNMQFNEKAFLSVPEYVKTMRKVERLFPAKKITFLVCSDDILDEADFKDINAIFPKGNEIEDMYSLANCNYILGAPSTYNGWAAFYGKVPLLWLKNREQDIKLDDFKVPYRWNGVEVAVPGVPKFIY